MVEDWDRYKDLEYYPDHFCNCPCHGRIIVQSHHKHGGIPKYLPGHQNRGKSSPRKGKTYVELYGVEKATEWTSNQKVSQNQPEVNAKRSASLKATYAQPEVKIQKRASAKIAANCFETKANQRIANDRPETKDRRSTSARAVMLERWADVEGREIMLEALASPVAKARRCEVHNRPEVIANHRAAGKRNWQNPEYVAKLLKVRGMKPNKPEKFLIELLQRLFPNQWKYVGNGAFWVTSNGKHLNPDFINIDGQKKIIEHFGGYYHGEGRTGIFEKLHEQERLDLFTELGYQTLVIWEKELLDVDTLIDKLEEFNSPDNLHLSLKRICKNKKEDDLTVAIECSYILTTVLSQCERGNTEHKVLVPRIIEKLNRITL